MKKLLLILFISISIITTGKSQFDLFGGIGLSEGAAKGGLDIGEEVGGTLHFGLMGDALKISPSGIYKRKTEGRSYAGLTVPLSLHIPAEFGNSINIDAGFYVDTVIEGLSLESATSSIDVGYHLKATVDLDGLLLSVGYNSGISGVDGLKDRGISASIGYRLVQD